ncbi:hypothetical protein [Kitasatospora sp. NPDC097643]|uniref:hypothetical protein n=1 Tax=Kitasatospora sp. NPDC097643 TaxID=3157230 RepID=UPI00332B4D70
MTRGRKSSIIGGAFGLAFVAMNAGAIAPLAVPLRLLAVAAFVGLFFTPVREVDSTEVADGAGGTLFGRRYWLVVAAEAAGAVGGILALKWVFDAPELTVAWIALVVGLHFFALGAVWRQASLHVLAAAMSVCGAAGLILGAVGVGTPVVAAVAGIAPGVLLLASVWWSVLGASRARATAGR